MKRFASSICRVNPLFAMILVTMILVTFAANGCAQTNIAPNGVGYTWHTMTSPTGTNNQTAAAGVNNGNLTVGVNADVAGEPAQNQYEAGGVIFSSAQSGITKVDFINGSIDTNGNGFFESSMALQSYNGTAWTNVSGWSLSPAYPYTTAAGGVTYTFTGAALNSVRGIRVVGLVRCSCLDNSWSWIVNEVRIYATTTADFSLAASPSSNSVTAGGNASYTATIGALNGFNSAVALSVTGLPTGATAAFNPTSVTGSGTSTLTVTTTSSTPAGTYTLTLKGTSGSLSHTATVTLVVSAAGSGNFTITATPATQSVTAGNGTSYTATITGSGGFSGVVTLSASGLPTGTTGTFNPTSVAGSGTSALNVTTASTTAAGTYTITITGTSGSLVHSATVTLKVSSNTGNVLSWMGHNWDMTNGGMAGVIQGSQNNISVDANGYLHMKISKSGSTWTGCELFTEDNLGFGTYQWVLQGTNFYNMDKPIVLGLFPYGPQAGIGVDGENEIDAEFSHWNGDFGSTPVNADFTYYPSTGNGPNASFEDDFQVNAPTSSTSTVRMVWTSTTIDSYIMSGTVPVTSAPTNILKHDTFHGNTTTIPQDAVPLGMNLWAWNAKPTNSWDIVIQSFQYVHP